jgi:hypothetical protein
VARCEDLFGKFEYFMAFTSWRWKSSYPNDNNPLKCFYAKTTHKNSLCENIQKPKLAFVSFDLWSLQIRQIVSSNANGAFDAKAGA